MFCFRPTFILKKPPWSEIKHFALVLNKLLSFKKGKFIQVRIYIYMYIKYIHEHKKIKKIWIWQQSIQQNNESLPWNKFSPSVNIFVGHLNPLSLLASRSWCFQKLCPHVRLHVATCSYVIIQFTAVLMVLLKLLVRLFHTSDLFIACLFIRLAVMKDSGRETPKQAYQII